VVQSTRRKRGNENKIQEEEMNSLTRFAVVALALALVGAAHAASFKFETAKVEITSPEGWNSSQEGDVVKIATPDNSMAVVFMILPEGLEDKAIEEIEKSLAKEIGDVAWKEKPQHEEINGMAAEIWEGSAKEGKLGVDAVYINTPADKSLGIYWFSAPEAAQKYDKDIETIIKGLKPLGGAAASPKE
jgi:hypothetical protein